MSLWGIYLAGPESRLGRPIRRWRQVIVPLRRLGDRQRHQRVPFDVLLTVAACADLVERPADVLGRGVLECIERNVERVDAHDGEVVQQDRTESIEIIYVQFAQPGQLVGRRQPARAV